MGNAEAAIQSSRKAYKAGIETVNMMRLDAKEQRDEIRKLKNDIYANNIGDMKMSEIWHIVEVKESALNLLDADIKSRWAKVQNERKAVEKTWKKLTSKINERRKSYQDEMRAVNSKRILAKEHRSRIRELRGIIYKRS